MTSPPRGRRLLAALTVLPVLLALTGCLGLPEPVSNLNRPDMVVDAKPWVPTTDRPSGIRFQLPGRAKVERHRMKGLRIRQYTAHPEPRTEVAVTVVGNAPTLRARALRTFATGWLSQPDPEMRTRGIGEYRALTVAGLPAADFRALCRWKHKQGPCLALARIVLLRHKIVFVTTAGTPRGPAGERAIRAAHQRLTASLQLP